MVVTGFTNLDMCPRWLLLEQLLRTPGRGPDLTIQLTNRSLEISPD